MSDSIARIVWQHGDSEVTFAQGRWPVVIGTTSAADIRVAGPGGQTLAQLDVVEGRAIVQPLLRPSPVLLDGETLQRTQSLGPGQVLEVFGIRLLIAVDDDALRLEQQSQHGAFETAPPVLPDAPADGAIREAAWQPAVASDAGERRALWPWFTGAALALLATAVWWLTTSVSIRLETTPALPDTVEIAGPGWPLKLGERWLLRPGLHEFRLATAGYRDLEQRIVVDGSLSTLVLTQQPLPGSVVVSADAPVAEALLDDGAGSELSAALPAQFEGLLPGTYALRVRADGYLPWRGTIEVAGRATEQQVEIDLIADRAALAVATEPAGARVILLDDNRLLAARTPATVQLPSGEHVVLYQLDGYKPVERRYRAFAGASDTAATITLEPADASLRVQSNPAGANVLVDGRYRGVTPLTLALEPQRRYDITLSRGGYAAVSRSIALASGQTRNLAIDLSAQNGDLTVRTIPEDAEVLINGRPAGAGTVTVSLPARPQRIVVRKPGYQRYAATVTPRPGFPQTVDVRLLTEAEAALAKIEQRVQAANGHALRYVQGGTFQRGSSRREADRRSDEALRDVRITRPFYAATHEVTNRQFDAFLKNHSSAELFYASLAGDSNPVVNVSWQQAAAYCNWLSEQEQREPAYAGEFGALVAVDRVVDGYRLPTEAEWVWMARYGGRPGNALRFGWGDSLPPPEKAANLADDSAKGLIDNIVDNYFDGFPASAPVGRFTANALGLFDLDGNVSEWVEDYYETSPSTDGALIDPRGPRRGTDRVIRGPSYRSANVAELRLARRAAGVDGRDDLGFRVVRTVVDSTAQADEDTQ